MPWSFGLPAPGGHQRSMVTRQFNGAWERPRRDVNDGELIGVNYPKLAELFRMMDPPEFI